MMIKDVIQRNRILGSLIKRSVDLKKDFDILGYTKGTLKRLMKDSCSVHRLSNYKTTLQDSQYHYLTMSSVIPIYIAANMIVYPEKILLKYRKEFSKSGLIMYTDYFDIMSVSDDFFWIYYDCFWRKDITKSLIKKYEGAKTREERNRVLSVMRKSVLRDLIVWSEISNLAKIKGYQDLQNLVIEILRDNHIT